MHIEIRIIYIPTKITTHILTSNTNFKYAIQCDWVFWYWFSNEIFWMGFSNSPFFYYLKWSPLLLNNPLKNFGVRLNGVWWPFFIDWTNCIQIHYSFYKSLLLNPLLDVSLSWPLCDTFIRTCYIRKIYPDDLNQLLRFYIKNIGHCGSGNWPFRSFSSKQ